MDKSKNAPPLLTIPVHTVLPEYRPWSVATSPKT